MKKFYLLFILLTAIPLFSADWEPFPLNQRSYFRSDDGIIYVLGADSTIIDEGKQIYLLNSKFPKRYDKCDTSLREAYNWSDNQITDFIDFGDKIEVNAESIKQNFDKHELQPFIFYGSAQKDFQWDLISERNSGVFDTLKIKCVEVVEKEMLGLLDSVKTFYVTPSFNHPKFNKINNFTFELSKNYGFIKFIQPENIMNSADTLFMLELAGFEKSGERIGYTRPKFEDFFHLKVGDVLKWEFCEREYGYPIKFNYKTYWDKIVLVEENSEYTKYVYNRLIYSEPKKFTTEEYKIIKIYRRDFNQMINGAINNFHIFFNPCFSFMGYDNFPCVNYIKSFGLDSIDNRGYQNLTFENSGLWIDTLKCFAMWATDSDTRYRINTLYGRAEQSLSSLNSIYEKVVGAKIDGIIYGDYSEIPDDVQQELEITDFSLFPNPASDILKIRGYDFSGYNYKIINLLGETILSGIIENNAISVSELNSGIYFLQVSEGANVFVRKFVR